MFVAWLSSFPVWSWSCTPITILSLHICSQSWSCTPITILSLHICSQSWCCTQIAGWCSSLFWSCTQIVFIDLIFACLRFFRNALVQCLHICKSWSSGPDIIHSVSITRLNCFKFYGLVTKVGGWVLFSDEFCKIFEVFYRTMWVSCKLLQKLNINRSLGSVTRCKYKKSHLTKLCTCNRRWSCTSTVPFLCIQTPTVCCDWSLLDVGVISIYKYLSLHIEKVAGGGDFIYKSWTDKKKKKTEAAVSVNIVSSYSSLVQPSLA